MDCPKCNGKNPPTAHYCSSCGAPMPRAPPNDSTIGWTRSNNEECQNCGFRNVVGMTYFGGDSYCQACGLILPSAARDRENEDERKGFWREKYAPLGIVPSSDLLKKLGEAGHSIRCPFCDETFGPLIDGMTDFNRENDVVMDHGLSKEEGKVFLDRFSDPSFRLKMHLILLHDNPTRMDVDRTKEAFWQEVLGFIDVQPRVSNRIFLGEIKKIWMELEKPKKKGV